MPPGLGSRPGPAEPPGDPSARDSVPPAPPLCGLAFTWPRKPHSRGMCPVGRHARPGILTPIISKESQAWVDSMSHSLRARTFSGGCGLGGGGDCGW